MKRFVKNVDALVDGYDIHTIKLIDDTWHNENITVYRVYTWQHENNRTVKHYLNGYSTHKQMLSEHPELIR